MEEEAEAVGHPDEDGDMSWPCTQVLQKVGLDIGAKQEYSADTGSEEGQWVD